MRVLSNSVKITLTIKREKIFYPKKMVKSTANQSTLGWYFQKKL